MVKPDASRSAPGQKPHGLSIHEVNFAQIQHDAATFCCGTKKLLQLSQSFRVDAAAQGKDYGVPVGRPVDPQRHRPFPETMSSHRRRKELCNAEAKRNTVKIGCFTNRRFANSSRIRERFVKTDRRLREE